MNKIRLWLQNNEEYLFGLLLVVISAIVFLSLFAFNSISMQEGWYQIYAKWVNNGLLPYKDFHLVVTPFSLLVYSLIYKFFGANLYPFHFMGLVSKTILLGFAYHLFTYVFPKKYAAFSVLFGAIILISIVYDNGILTYNDIIVTISIFCVILFYKFVNQLELKNNNSWKYALALGLTLGVTMLFKQTFGVLMIFSTTILMFLFSVKIQDYKTALKNIFVCGISFSSILGAFLVFFHSQSMLIPFINDTFLKSTSAKGNISQILFWHFSFIGSGNLLKIFYVTIFILIGMYFLTKRYGISGVNTKNIPDKIFYPACIGLSLFSVYLGYYCVQSGIIKNVVSKVFIINNFFIDLGTFPSIFITIAAFYMFCKFLFEKNYDSKFAKYFILFAYTFVFAYSWSISKVLPNISTFNYVLIMACLLTYKTKFNNIKNGVLYLFIFFCLFLGSVLKTISPSIWHSWESGSLVSDLKESEKIPVLKGLKLPKDEIALFDSIRGISDKYTYSDDKIFVYMNNQLFYYLLDREPLTSNVSNYWDVCSDEMAENDAELLKNNPPKLIVYMQFPMSVIGMHESIFREGKYAKQRLIDKQILSMLNNGQYVKVQEFTSFIPVYEDYIKDNSEMLQYKSLKNDLQKLVSKMIYTNKEDELSKFEQKYRYDDIIYKITKIEETIFIKEKFKLKRTPIPNGYSLKVLVRKDVYDAKN